MEALGQLTAGIAHNFNNLLQAIVGSLELAQTESLSAVADDAVTLALDTTRRAGGLITQLMIFTRPNSRRTQRSIDLARVAQDVVSICKKTFDRRIEINVDINPGQYAIGDSMQLEQAVLNLCINARDALEEVERTDPTIRVGLETLEVDRPTAVGPAKRGLFTRLTVSDNGPGMDQEMKAKIFDPFFTTKEIDRGTGLGLSTVFGIVRDHGGWIDCDTEPGVGTRFSVYLLASPAQDEPRPITRTSETTGTETILIIEDEEMIRYTVQHMLEAKGATRRWSPSTEARGWSCSIGNGNTSIWSCSTSSSLRHVTTWRVSSRASNRGESITSRNPSRRNKSSFVSKPIWKELSSRVGWRPSAGSGSMVLIAGEPGSGKSRMA